MKIAALAGLLFGISSLGYCDENSAWLGAVPTYSFQQGQGVTLDLSIEQHLKEKWYLVPYAEFSEVRTFRDMNGKLDLEYRFSDRLVFSIGEGYGVYHYFGDDPVPSHAAHAGVKVRIW